MASVTYIVLTCEDYIEKRGFIINKTWRRRVEKEDRFYFLSSKPNTEQNVLGYNDPDDYNGAFLKLISFFKNHVINTDWIFICDDDTFVYPERLKKLLANYNFCSSICVCRTGTASHIGNNFNIQFPLTFPSGGAGFALSASLFNSVKKYINNANPVPHCLYGDVNFGVWARNINFTNFIDRCDLLKAQNPDHPENKGIKYNQIVTMHYCNEKHFNDLYNEAI